MSDRRRGHAFFVAAGASLFLTVCGSAGRRIDSPASPSVGAEFALTAGQRVTLGGGDLSLRFSRVSEDSRCPTGVTCVWEGDAVVEVQASRAGATSTFDLHTSGRFSREATAGAYRIVLVRLDPVPAEGTPLRPSDYTGTFRVVRD